jgi:hypothetical protein
MRVICAPDSVYSIRLIVLVIVQAKVGPGNIQPNLGDPGLYALSILGPFFQALNGFVNFFIYIRPKYRQWRDYEPSCGRIWAFQQVYTCQSPPTDDPQKARIATDQVNKRLAGQSMKEIQRSTQSSDNPTTEEEEHPGFVPATLGKESFQFKSTEQDANSAIDEEMNLADDLSISEEGTERIPPNEEIKSPIPPRQRVRIIESFVAQQKSASSQDNNTSSQSEPEEPQTKVILSPHLPI